MSDLPPDPNCLHCYLYPVIEQWMARHPDKPAQDVMIEVAQSLGEIVGAQAPQPDCVGRLVRGLMPYIEKTALYIALSTPPQVKPS